MPRISNADHQRRWDNLQAKVAEHELDLFLVSSRDSVYYLTGIVCEPLERPMFLLVRRKGAPVFLVPTLERDHLIESSGGSECLTRSAAGIDELTITAWKPVARLKGRLVRRALGVEANHCG